MPPDPRLQRLLGGDALAPLRARLRRHFARNSPDVVIPTLRLDNLDAEAHRALCQLTGRPVRPARSMTLDVCAVDAALHAAGLAQSLRDALERLDGPIVDKAQERLDLQARWNSAIAQHADNSLLRAWSGTSPAQSLIKRLSRTPDEAAPLLSAAARVLCALPAQGQPRSQLAARLLGDAHGLDAGRPVATLVLAALRHQERHLSRNDSDVQQDDSQQAGGADDRQRDVWARAGVLVNELARPALVLNLPVMAGAPTPGHPGEPAYLSLRQLLRSPPRWAVDGQRVYVCENPNVVAIAADQLGERCAPLVCTDGMPAAAQRTLLEQLQHAGAQLHYHGDFDWPGITIANVVLGTWSAVPWRMHARDYEAAVMAPTAQHHALAGVVVEADWSAALTAAMRCHGAAIAEEAVVTELLRDLLAKDAAVH